MKYKNINHLIIGLLFIGFLGSCVKKADTFVDFSHLQDVVTLRKGGLSNFKAANQRIDVTSPDPDSVTLTIDLASINASSQAITVRIGVDNPKIAEYNAANSTAFTPFSSNQFTIVDSVITIPAGEHYATTTVILHQDQFDPTVSYLLPISILDASGKVLSSNQNTIYYNLIGNPIAGVYTQEWIRYNSVTQTGSPAYDQTFDGVFGAIDPLTIGVASGTGVTYIVSFTNTGGVLSDFNVKFDPADVTAAGITITSGPVIVLADPVARTYTFNFTYLNGSGSPRNITDKFTP